MLKKTCAGVARWAELHHLAVAWFLVCNTHYIRRMSAFAWLAAEVLNLAVSLALSRLRRQRSDMLSSEAKSTNIHGMGSAAG